jgi:hypothetical protein
MGTAVTWSAVGVPVIVVSGTLLHFAFDRCGRHALVGVFAPVNESVWEHLKMAYWPTVAYALLRWVITDDVPADYFMVNAAAVYTMGLVMLGLYLVTSAAPWRPSLKASLVTDGLIFVAAVAIGQLVGHVVHFSNGWAGTAVGVAAFALPAVGLAVTTFWPPRRELFRDQQDHTFGIRHRP